jgi:hypothetical protein
MFPSDRCDLLLKTEGYQNRVSRNGRDWYNCGHVWYCQCRSQTLDGSSAATDITVIDSEISQFCVVVKQIQSILGKGRTNVKYSITALVAMEEIAGQCRPAFGEFQEILDDLKMGKAEPNFLGRLKRTLKRPKVQILQKRLETSKLTLSCILTTLLFVERVSSRRCVSIIYFLADC